MKKFDIPTEWDLGADPRYKRQNMERAMRGKIERGLVEIITNSDDSYRDLEDEGKQSSGKVRIEIERKRKGQPSIVRIRDRAGGMTRKELFDKLGVLGRRTSGFEIGKARRGLHGRGARDIACFGTIHFESIKGDEYNHLIIPPSLRCRFTQRHHKKVTEDLRKKLGIPRSNGTMVTIEVDSRFKIPQHETLIENFPLYYSLRDLLSNPNREVTLLDINTVRESPLHYSYPEGEIVFDDEISFPEYPGVNAHLTIRRHETPFQQDTTSPCREGILIKSAASIHDCTHFGMEADPFAWRFTGEVCCEFIDSLVREYDDRDETNPDYPNHPENNPMRILDPFRDGLLLEHPFTRALHNRCRGILKEFIEKLKISEVPPKQAVTNETLNRKLDKLSKEITPLLEKKLKELEEEIPLSSIDESLIMKLSNGLHIIPPEEMSIVVNESKTFSIIVKHYESLDESTPIHINSSNDDVKLSVSPVYLKKLSKDRKAGRTTFAVSCDKVGTEAFIEAHYDGYSNSVLVKIIEQPTPQELPEGLSFDKRIYHLKINKEKILTLWLKTTCLDKAVPVEVISDHPEIVIKGGGMPDLHKTDLEGVLMAKCRTLGRQPKARGTITARVKGFGPAHTRALVEDPPKLKFYPVEDYFGSVRYDWDDEDPYLLKIAAKHPSIGRYLGTLTEKGYPGINSSLYHAVLAEVVSEALAFSVLAKQFGREGDQGKLDYTYTDFYYHKHFSDFLAISHKCLVTEVIYDSQSE